MDGKYLDPIFVNLLGNGKPGLSKFVFEKQHVLKDV